MEKSLLFQIEEYSKADYIETDTGNKINRQATICGSQNIILGGKSIIKGNTIIRGDLRRLVGSSNAVVVAVGKYCLIGENNVIRPPYKIYKQVFSYYPLKIGDYVTIGNDCVIEAASIGSFVTIGKNCIIGRFAIIKDCCKILDNSVVAPNTVMASFSVYGGNPAQLVDELSEATQELSEASAKEFYHQIFIGN